MKEHSDYDFFVIVTNLPESKERDKISLELGRYVGRRYYKSVQIHLTAEKELEESLNPLFYGILTGYSVLYGEEAWEKNLSRWRPIIRKEKPRLIEEDKKVFSGEACALEIRNSSTHETFWDNMISRAT